MNLDDFRPSPRFDGTAWTTATVQEAPTEHGPWTDLLVQALSAEPDAENPIARSFTVTPTLPSGWYRVVFSDGTNAENAGAVQALAVDNRPTVDQLQRQLKGVDLSLYDDAVLQEQLDFSIAWVEDQCATSFNGRKVTELYDGNTTNQIVVRKRPVTSIVLLTVETPILGYIRVYEPAEIKLYRKQGVAKVFTYKLAVEQALFNTLDYQAWGVIFPPLPQCVHVTYTYGYPRYDPESDTTALDDGTIVLTGDQRDPEEVNWLTNLQQAAVLDAACVVLTMAGQQVGLVASMSFDGYARTLNAGAFAAQVQGYTAKRDELMKRRKRQFYMSTIG